MKTQRLFSMVREVESAVNTHFTSLGLPPVFPGGMSVDPKYRITGWGYDIRLRTSFFWVEYRPEGAVVRSVKFSTRGGTVIETVIKTGR